MTYSGVLGWGLETRMALGLGLRLHLRMELGLGPWAWLVLVLVLVWDVGKAEPGEWGLNQLNFFYAFCGCSDRPSGCIGGALLLQTY